MADILYPVIILTVLAAVFAVTIAICSKKLAVTTDERVEAVTILLAGANCGACGKAGCADFAKALVGGEAKLSDCPVTAADKKKEIDEIIGVDSEAGEKSIVVNACCGGASCADKYDYQGYGNCGSVELLAGGRKACYTGCIGMGECADNCAFDAIKIIEGVAVVNKEKCVACGACILRCPKKIIKRIPESAKYYVACANTDKGKDVRNVCKNGCIACSICAKICPENAILMVNNLPVIDYAKCVSCGKCAEKCPSKCIKAV